MAGIFHAYYTVALAPAVAALVGIGAARCGHGGHAAWSAAVLAGVTSGPACGRSPCSAGPRTWCRGCADGAAAACWAVLFVGRRAPLAGTAAARRAARPRVAVAALASPPASPGRRRTRWTPCHRAHRIALTAGPAVPAGRAARGGGAAGGGSRGALPRAGRRAAARPGPGLGRHGTGRHRANGHRPRGGGQASGRRRRARRDGRAARRHRVAAQVTALLEDAPAPTRGSRPRSAPKRGGLPARRPRSRSCRSAGSTDRPVAHPRPVPGVRGAGKIHYFIAGGGFGGPVARPLRDRRLGRVDLHRPDRGRRDALRPHGRVDGGLTSAGRLGEPPRRRAGRRRRLRCPPSVAPATAPGCAGPLRERRRRRGSRGTRPCRSSARSR